MSGYAKLFSSILTSTVWDTAPATRVVWITLLALSDRDGIVEASVPGLTKVAGVTRVECETALALFLSPDEDSRTKDHDGRRIQVIDGGWQLLNYEKYRDKQTADETRAKNAARQKRKRERDSKRELMIDRDAKLPSCIVSRDVTPSHAEIVTSRDVTVGNAPYPSVTHSGSGSGSGSGSEADQDLEGGGLVENLQDEEQVVRQPGKDQDPKTPPSFSKSPKTRIPQDPKPEALERRAGPTTSPPSLGALFAAGWHEQTERQRRGEDFEPLAARVVQRVGTAKALHAYTAALTAFAASCESRGKEAVFEWFATQLDEWLDRGERAAAVAPQCDPSIAAKQAHAEAELALARESMLEVSGPPAELRSLLGKLKQNLGKHDGRLLHANATPIETEPMNTVVAIQSAQVKS